MKKREKERFYVEIDPYRLPISLPTFYSIAVVPVSNKAITHLPVPSFNDLIHSSNVATSSADGSGIYVTTSPYVPNTRTCSSHLRMMLAADTYVRWKAMQGQKLKLAMAVEGDLKESNSPAKVKSMNTHFVERFRDELGFCMDLCANAGVKCDVTVGTHGEENLAAIKDVWARLLKAGYIYKGQYAGWFNKKSYHLTRNSNVSKVDINGIKRMVHENTGVIVYWEITECYKFNLKKVLPILRELYAPKAEGAKDVFLQPPFANEFITDYLTYYKEYAEEDFPLSMRSDLYGGQDGVSVPEDNTQTLYPWFVHFCSHITASGALKAADSTGDNSAIEVHVVSAEIVHISAIFFPIILYALGIKIPNHIIYHKSYSGIQSGMRGEIKSSTEPYEALIDHGADAVRFAAMSAAHDNHYAFSSLTAVKKVKKRYLSSLIGNYILRITSKRVNPGSFYPNSYVSERSFPVVKLVEDCNHFVPKITEAANVCDLKEYCILVLDFLHSMNVGINKSEIWKLSPVMELSEMSDLYKDALYAAFEHLRIACIISQPVLPETMKKFLDFLKIPEEERTLENAAVGKKYIRSTPDPIPEKTILDIGALDAIIIKTDD